MPNEVQEYLAAATMQAAPALVEAYLRLPEDKRTWQPSETARSAQDQFIECVLLAGYTADLIATHTFPSNQMDVYVTDEAACEAMSTEELQAKLLENVERVSRAIRQTSDAALSIEIVMPWRTQTLGEILIYPYWNMSYHMAQINYLASMLGCLS